MVNPKQQTLQNQSKLHDIKFTNSFNYLATQLDLNSTPTQLNKILAALKTVASKLENLAEQLSAHMTLDDLEPYLQKPADASILVLHYADKISSRQIQRDNIFLRSHLSDSIPGSHRHFEEETTRPPTEAVDHPHQQNPSSSSHHNPNTNILAMTAEQLSRHLAQSADRNNFCAGEPPDQTLNMETTDTSQVRQSRPQQSHCDEYQETPTLPPMEHQTILPANPTQPPQLSATVDPYYTRSHIAYSNNYHQCPSNSSVLAINYTVPAMPTTQNHSLHQG